MPRPSSEPRVILTEGSIRILWEEKTLTILPAAGPMIDKDLADFTVDLDSILTWDPPHDGEEIDVDELREITQAIEKEFDRLGLVVEFE